MGVTIDRKYLTIDRKAHLIEDEQLTAVIEGLDNDNVLHGASAKSNRLSSKNTAPV